ncbi:MAG: hypothetical protein F6K09_37620 [Merismopedia sp. SIO2A8]|nr:hypothetical protein [Merismopedia sp. SIO2A8]
MEISRPGDNLEQIIIDTINQAQVSIDVAIQELNLPLIADALVAKHQDEVAVRVIVENQYRSAFSDLGVAEVAGLAERDRHKYNEFLQLVDLNRDGQVQAIEALQRDAIRILEAAKIPLIDDTEDGSKGSGLMHHKFLVIDGQTSLMGSANFTVSGIHGDFSHPESVGNANHVAVIQNEAIAQELTTEFELMWGDGPGGQPNSQFGLQKPYRPPTTIQMAPDSNVTLYFSPISDARYSWEESGNGLIGQTLNTAQSSLDLALFVFSDQSLSRILQQQSDRDRTIRALIDAEFIYRPYSEALDMMGVSYPNQHETFHCQWHSAGVQEQ